MRRYQIAVIGAAEAKEWEKELAFSVGRLIATEGCILLTGGRGGVMEAASQGASEAGGFVAGIVPGSEGNQYLDLIIKNPDGPGQKRYPCRVSRCSHSRVRKLRHLI